MSATVAEPETPTLQENLYSKFILIDLECRRPSFVTKLTRKSVAENKTLEVQTQIDGSTISDEAEKMVDKQVNLLSVPIRKLFNTAYGRVKQFVEDPELTQPFVISGLRVLPISRRDDLFGNWPAIRTRFQDDLELFFDRYEADVVQPAHDYWSPILGAALYNKLIRPHLPPLQALRAKCGVKLVPGIFNYEDAEDAQEALEDLARNIRDQLSAAIADLARKLQDNSRLSADSLNDMRKALAAARAFADVVDPKLLAHVRVMERQISTLQNEAMAYVGKDGLTMTKIIKSGAGTLNKAISSLSTALADPGGLTESMARFGAAPRKIRA
jgi:hypothetical protein